MGGHIIDAAVGRPCGGLAESVPCRIRLSYVLIAPWIVTLPLKVQLNIGYLMRPDGP